MDALKYLAKPRGGTVAQIPIASGRAIAAVFSTPPHGRATPIQRRLQDEGLRLIERRRLPADPPTGFYMIGIYEQLEGFLIDALSRRVFMRDGRTVKRSINTYEQPAVEVAKDHPAG